MRLSSAGCVSLAGVVQSNCPLAVLGMYAVVSCVATDELCCCRTASQEAEFQRQRNNRAPGRDALQSQESSRSGDLLVLPHVLVTCAEVLVTCAHVLVTCAHVLD